MTEALSHTWEQEYLKLVFLSMETTCITDCDPMSLRLVVEACISPDSHELHVAKAEKHVLQIILASDYMDKGISG